jgi:hypothetical protein
VLLVLLAAAALGQTMAYLHKQAGLLPQPVKVMLVAMAMRSGVQA